MLTGARRDELFALRPADVDLVHLTLSRSLHHHAVLPDEAFTSLDEGAVSFVRIVAATLEELKRILGRVTRRTTSNRSESELRRIAVGREA